MTRITPLFLLCLLFFALPHTYAQDNLKKQIGDSLTVIANEQIATAGKIRVKNININQKKKTVEIITSATFGYLNFREESVKRTYAAIRRALPPAYSRYKVQCKAPDHLIEDLVPNYFRRKNDDDNRRFKTERTTKPLITKLSQPYKISKGLPGKNLALWQSHGWYYNQTLAHWNWQRARLLQTVEDLYSAAYVLPLLAPMLENAGATVLLPRERDVRCDEVIVDNDSAATGYTEQNAKFAWAAGDAVGFANPKAMYVQDENPFALGTFRSIETVSDEDDASTVCWTPNIPQAGLYAVYVSYKTLADSPSDATYIVHHAGGESRFRINQTMCGGTWVYLGTFWFELGNSPADGSVTLTNHSRERGKTVTADAVKFGGGMGNIGRQPYANVDYKSMQATDSLVAVADSVNEKPVEEYLPDSLATVPLPEYSPEMSGYCRYAEGARYWLQWAGMPDSIYSRTHGTDDYKDDIQARSAWVNYLTKNLHTPIDLALAFHTDAGTTSNDSVVGTLSICSTQNGKKTTYRNGVSRMAGRDLADVVSSQIVSDMRRLYTPRWTNRGVMDKSYSEARNPDVPTMLLEALSHQNLADMTYGLDPEFRFHFCRAVYKGILNYMQTVYDHDYEVQPLPVHAFSAVLADDDEVKLHWQPTPDPLDSACQAKHYVVYTRIDGGGFDNGVLVNANSCKLKIEHDKIYSFKITAVNDGGESFPSEILSVCRNSRNPNEVLIVNGFDRIAAPQSFASADNTQAGFRNDEDAGVPYLSDIAFVGEQFEFRRNQAWKSDDAPGFGASHAQYETRPIAGNTFDYPFVHGKAIQQAGYSFVSCSRDAVSGGFVSLNEYKFVDLILGKQKETLTGYLRRTPKYQPFPLEFRRQIEAYCTQSGNLFVSGAFVASDTSTDSGFIANTLKIRLLTGKASATGRVKTVETQANIFPKSNFSYYDTPNTEAYHIESPDAIEPADRQRGCTVCRYAENNLSAGVVYFGPYRICALGFPFEIIREENERNRLMEAVLRFFSLNINH